MRNRFKDPKQNSHHTQDLEVVPKTGHGECYSPQKYVTCEIFCNGDFLGENDSWVFSEDNSKVDYCVKPRVLIESESA